MDYKQHEGHLLRSMNIPSEYLPLLPPPPHLSHHLSSCTNVTASYPGHFHFWLLSTLSEKSLKNGNQIWWCQFPIQKFLLSVYHEPQALSHWFHLLFHFCLIVAHLSHNWSLQGSSWNRSGYYYPGDFFFCSLSLNDALPPDVGMACTPHFIQVSAQISPP